MELKRTPNLLNLVFKAIGLALATAVLVLTFLGQVSTNAALAMLALGTFCLALASF